MHTQVAGGMELSKGRPHRAPAAQASTPSEAGCILEFLSFRGKVSSVLGLAEYNAGWGDLEPQHSPAGWQSLPAGK